MKYVRLEDNRAVEIIPEFNPAFPEIPIEKRYTKVFIDELIKVNDEVEVLEGWVYDELTNTFSEYKEPEFSNIELREQAYETLNTISWEGSMITVDKANQLWTAYTAEGNVEKATQLTQLIVEAKTKIREMYPDEVEAE